MIPLENSLARELDGKPKFLTQEKNIIGWWWPYAVATTNGVVPILSQQKETFMLGQHHLMVRLVPEKRMTESGIVFPKSKQQTYLGEVIQVSMWEEEVTVGDMVAFKASPSGRFEYFGEDVVLLPKRLALVRIRDNKMQAI
jgi:co-chaperonin GroES (HSP10)